MQTWSEKRGSNPRPQPWQGCALPAELFSLCWIMYIHSIWKTKLVKLFLI